METFQKEKMFCDQCDTLVDPKFPDTGSFYSVGGLKIKKDGSLGAFKHVVFALCHTCRKHKDETHSFLADCEH
ncbi:MAG: hypothetical protein K2Z81_17315 [Cyanobacteria bacterium]|nr:hypothetical protein [Cyanobacteriota bacterium]